MLEKNIEDIAKSAKNSCDILEDERQSLWTVAQQLDYWLQLYYPSNIKAATEKVDTILWKVLESVAFSSFPRAKFSSENENPHNISITGIEDSSYQE